MRETKGEYIVNVCMIRLLARLSAAVCSPKNFQSVQCRLIGVIQTLVLPKQKDLTVFLPARILLPMPRPKHVPFWKGPAPEEGTPWISGEPSRRKGSARTSAEGRGLRPPARGAPPRRARGVSCPCAMNVAEIVDLVAGCSEGNSS